MLLSSLLISGLLASVPTPAPSALVVQESEAQELRATPIPRLALPADTAFVLHFDLQKFFASSWWRAMGSMDELKDALEASDELREIKEQLGVDPFHDLIAVTVFGRDDQGDGAAVLLRGTSAMDRAIEAARGAGEHSTVSRGDLPIDAWAKDDGGLFASFHATPDGDRLAILSESADDVARVVRAASGDVPRLADAAEPAVDARAMDGSFFYLEVGVPLGRLLEGSPASRVARDVKKLTIQLGEREDEVFVDMRVTAADRVNARKIADVLNGVRSFITMSGALEQMPPAAQELYAGVVAEVEGAEVRVGFQMASRDLAYMLEELRELVQ